jgi:hypothetical protein
MKCNPITAHDLTAVIKRRSDHHRARPPKLPAEPSPGWLSIRIDELASTRERNKRGRRTSREIAAARPP